MFEGKALHAQVFTYGRSPAEGTYRYYHSLAMGRRKSYSIMADYRKAFGRDSKAIEIYSFSGWETDSSCVLKTAALPNLKIIGEDVLSDFDR